MQNTASQPHTSLLIKEFLQVPLQHVSNYLADEAERLEASCLVGATQSNFRVNIVCDLPTKNAVIQVSRPTTTMTIGYCEELDADHLSNHSKCIKMVWDHFARLPADSALNLDGKCPNGSSA